MRIVVTAGPTREYIDTVRFITNASSGRMGCAIAMSAAEAGHKVTLLAGAVCPQALTEEVHSKCEVVRFISTANLRKELEDLFDSCDVLIMAAAVGDFTVAKVFPAKLRRSDGPVRLELLPTEDILAGLGNRKRNDQIIIAFAVEDGSPDEIQQKARSEMIAKNADYVVANSPPAMGAPESFACMLSRSEVVIGWSLRTKELLAAEIMSVLDRRA